MTGFFGRLISRSAPSLDKKSTTEGILQPRIPSLFEVQAGLGPSPAAVGEINNLVESGEGDQRSETSIDGSHQLQPAFAFFDQAHEGQSPYTPWEPHDRTEQEGDSKSEEIVQVENESDPRKDLTSGIHFHPKIGDAELIQAPKKVNSSEPMLVPAPPPSLEARNRQPDQRHVLASNRATEDSDESLSPSLHPASLSISGNPSRLEARKPSLLVPIPPSPADDDLQMPEIHINIGRIEVRTVTQGAHSPSPMPVAARPKLTLDEYLRQRNEGKR